MSDDGADDAMRELMGFSSFGMNKKQKLNSGDSSRPPKAKGTASNNTPLGTRKQTTAKTETVLDARAHDKAQSPQNSLPIHGKPSEALAPPSASKEIFDPSTAPFLSSKPKNVGQDDSQPAAEAASKSDMVYTTNDIRSNPAYWSNNTHHPKQNNDNEIGYASPWTGATMTNKELREYGKGKREVREDGSVVTVFFKPSFVEDNPWARLEKAKLREKSVGKETTAG